MNMELTMSIESNLKQTIIKEYQVNNSDTGSSMVQIGLLSERIRSLTDHLKIHKKDFHSRRGLLRLVNKRRKLLMYLKRKNSSVYNSLVKKLKLKG